MTELKINANSCTVRILDFWFSNPDVWFNNPASDETITRKFYDCLDVFSEQSIEYDFFFHPLFVRSAGFRVGEIHIAHRKRVAGSSCYHLVRGRFFSGLLDCFKAQKLLKKQQKTAL